MSKMIFVSLPVADLSKSIAFYEAIGAKNNPQFSDDSGACMVFSEAIYVMLMTHDKWASFTKKPITDAHQSSEVMLSYSCESRDAVDAMTEAAKSAGGVADISPPDELGFMYGRNFEDLDGHVWAPFWMDMSAMPAQG